MIISTGDNGLQLLGQGAFISDGIIRTGVPGGTATIDTGSVLNAGTIAVSTKQLTAITSEDGTVVNNGLMTVVTGGILDLASDVSGSGTIDVAHSSTLELGGAVTKARRSTCWATW